MTIRMKKLISSFAVTAALIFTFAAQAPAYFDANSFGDGTAKLNRFMYAEPGGDYTDNEVGVDLFTDNGMNFPSYNFEYSKVLHKMDPMDLLSNFATTDSWADVNMGFYASYWTPMGDTYGNEPGYTSFLFSTTDALNPEYTSGGYINTCAGNIWTEYGSTGTSAVVVGSTGDTRSYDATMNADSFVAGGMGNANNRPNYNFGEVGPSAPFYAEPGREGTSLESLDDGPGNYVDMYLWHAEKLNWADPVYDQVTDSYRAILRTGIDADGMLYTEIIPNAVPIPGAVFLLSSGMLAILGIRRKTSA